MAEEIEKMKQRHDKRKRKIEKKKYTNKKF